MRRADRTAALARASLSGFLFQIRARGRVPPRPRGLPAPAVRLRLARARDPGNPGRDPARLRCVLLLAAVPRVARFVRGPLPCWLLAAKWIVRLPDAARVLGDPARDRAHV